VGIFGFLLGIVFTFVGIYLSYKVGVVAMEAFSSLFLFVFIYSLLLKAYVFFLPCAGEWQLLCISSLCKLTSLVWMGI